jgi:hypothetical protein
MKIDEFEKDQKISELTKTVTHFQKSRSIIVLQGLIGWLLFFLLLASRDF